MKSISFPYRDPIYDLCGPRASSRDGEYGYMETVIDENSGPRCDTCRRKMKLTGENHYCGRYVVVAFIVGVPECY